MKTLKISLIVLGIILLTSLIFLWYAGEFSTITVEEKKSESYIIVGELYTGAYYKVNGAMEHVDSLLRSIGIVTTRGFGIYYDDPKSTPKEKCRSFVGNIISTNDLKKQLEIQSLGLKIDTIESMPSLIIDFPSKTSLAYMIGPMKAYPALVKYAKEKSLTPSLAIEIYDIPKKSTLYIMQLTQK